MTSPAQGAATDDGLHLEACLHCGGDLEYLERGVDCRCSFCGREETGHVRCPQGHYVCEACHGTAYLERLDRALADEGETSPFRLAEELLLLPGLPMLGCEHASLAAGAVMASLRNRGDAGVTSDHLQEALDRTRRQAVSAYCGLSGVCGIVPALGACFSVLVGAQCGKGPETRMTMELVSRLAAVTAAEAEPGCCKAFLRAGLRAFTDFADERLGLRFPDPDPIGCADAARHPHGCRGPTCAFHPVAEPLPILQTPVREETAMTTTGPAAQARYQDFFALAYADGVLNAKTKILVSLGASLAAGCSP